MNKRFSSILILGVLLLTATTIRAQDYSVYRDFSLGASLTAVLKQTNQKLADVNVVHSGPSPVQELAWWPPNIRGTSFQADSVEQILFSFHEGTLYKMTVSYDRGSTEGLTSEDMVKSISTKYGPATSVTTVLERSLKDSYEEKESLVASWENPKYSLNLVRSSFTGLFGLIVYSKQANAEAELSIAEALLLEKQNGPKKAAELAKQQSDDLEVARAKNQKTFRP